MASVTCGLTAEDRDQLRKKYTRFVYGTWDYLYLLYPVTRSLHALHLKCLILDGFNGVVWKG